MLRSTINHLQERKTQNEIIKQSEIITYQPKTFEKPNIVDIKSVITEHRKTSHKLSKTIRQAAKVGSDSCLYSDTKKSKIFLNEKNVTITKREHVKILNSFNPEFFLH